MGEIIVHEPLASQIREEAAHAGVDAENLIATAMRHYRFQAQRRKIETEAEWWRGMPAELRARYAGEFVAVHDKAVLDRDRDEEALRRRIRILYGKTPILITPAEGRREFRMVSTRLGSA
jgi:hypothetical protein